MWVLDSIRNGNFAELLLTVGTRVFVLLAILPVHEAAHGWMALRLGDPTAKFQGRLTLNPFAHLNWMGALFLILFGFGWANPVPVNPLYFRNRKRDTALTAIAGPASNLLAALVGAVLYNVLVLTGVLYAAGMWLWYILYSFILINVSLAAFNLLPVPPLDGSRIFAAILPDRWVDRVEQYERFLYIGMLLLLFSGVLDPVLSTVQNALYNLVVGVAGLPFRVFGL